MRLFKLPGIFVLGLLHPRGPSEVLSPILACFSHLFGSKTMEENSTPAAQGLPGRNAAGITMGGGDRDTQVLVTG